MKLILTLSSLFVGIFFLFAGDALFLSSAAVSLVDIGASRLTIGLVNTTFFLGAVFSSLAAQRVIANVGHVRSFCVFAGLFSVGVLMHTLIQNVNLWFVLRFIQGFCYYGLLIVIESWLNERSDSSFRARILAFYQIVFYVSFSLGVWLMGLKMTTNHIFIISAIFIILSLIPVGLTHITQPCLPARERISLPRLYSIVPLALVGSFVGGLLVNGFFTMAPVYILGRGFTSENASYFIIASMLGGFFLQWPVGKLSDVYGRRNAIILTSAISLIASALGWVLSDSLVSLYVLAFFFGSGAFTLYSLSVARANDVTQDDQEINVVEISRALLFCYGIGAMVSPTLLGISMDYLGKYGFDTVFVIFSVILLLTAIWQKDIPSEDRTAYIYMPGNTSGILPETELQETQDNSEIEPATSNEQPSPENTHEKNI